VAEDGTVLGVRLEVISARPIISLRCPLGAGPPCRKPLFLWEQ
jgi:hypothetical protein